MRIRPATAADAARLAELMLELGYARAAAEVTAFLAHPHSLVIFVAEDELGGMTSSTRMACGFAALVDSPGKRKTASPACPQGLKNPARSRPVLHNSTGPTATAESQAGAEENPRSAKREALMADGTGIGGRSASLSCPTHS
jgi:hypothetical protein